MALHPFFNATVRLHTAAELRKKGMGFLCSIRTAGQISDEDIAEGTRALSDDSGTQLPPELVAVTEGVGKLGDGHIIEAIVKFFQSPAGQALLQALVAALVAILTGA